LRKKYVSFTFVGTAALEKIAYSLALKRLSWSALIIT